jgi:hypothetical protein
MTVNEKKEITECLWWAVDCDGRFTVVHVEKNGNGKLVWTRLMPLYHKMDMLGGMGYKLDEKITVSPERDIGFNKKIVEHKPLSIIPADKLPEDCKTGKHCFCVRDNPFNPKVLCCWCERIDAYYDSLDDE